ncbi:hypothetical protein GF389_03180 [Candidatus Dojkabacteria bacterium]|nr:hypothetical protein [Candidatus Dojkabacteria bacterium]
MKQVFINLLSNAAKYNKPSGKITFSINTNSKETTFSVADTGIGIKKEDMKTLFTKFGRIQNKKTEDIEGTGLGLYVTKEIINKLGGEIKVESELGEGTTFTVTIPNKIKVEKEVK